MTIAFVGPDPASPHIGHAGGQLTATRGFAAFAAAYGLRIAWIDTAQSNFPVPPASQRMARSGLRLLQFIRLIVRRDCIGAILFAGAGMSFIERGLMATLARLAGKPSVLMIRSGHFQTHYRRSALFRSLARLLMRVPTRLGVQGKSWLPLLADAGVHQARMAVIPNWISDPPRAPHVRTLAPGSALQLVFAGWITSRKGIPELIEAARLLSEQNCDFSLTLVGGGTLLEEAQSAALEPSLAGKLLVTGWLDRDALAAELVAADILVLPSHAEGFPNILVEAMAEGMPVIATPVGAIPDTVIDGLNGTIVPVNDARAIAEAVRWYVTNPEAVERQSRASLTAVAAQHDRDTNCAALIAALSPAQGDLEEISR